MGKWWISRVIKQTQERSSGSIYTLIHRGKISIQSELVSYRIFWITNWRCFSYPGIENKFIFKSFILEQHLFILVKSSHDKGFYQTTSLRQKKLSHLNHLSLVSVDEISFHLMNAKTKSFLHLTVFLLVAK